VKSVVRPILITLCVTVILVAAIQGAGQLKVDHDSPLTADETVVVALVEKAQNAILEDRKADLVEMLEPAGLGSSRSASIMNSASLDSCVIFDTACVRAYLKSEGEHRLTVKETRRGEALLQMSGIFMSIREFLQTHKGQMEITFQRQPPPVIQVELHPPRRPDADQVPPALGVYESLTLNFVQTNDGWKISLLFPEPYSLVASLFQ